MAFRSLQLSAPIMRALADEGYTVPTPIQLKAIPPAISGRDLLGCAQTGTGKTAAFALPIIQRLSATTPTTKHHVPRALILAPTRELATQISESFRAYGRHANLTCTVVFGGVSQFHQVAALKKGVDIVVATPGRLIDLMQQKLVDLRSVEILVLDEADRMLDMGFIKPIRTIVATLTARKQTMLFSATMPAEIRQLAGSLLKNPVEVAVTPVASAAPMIRQAVCHVPQQQKLALLAHLLEDKSFDRVVVFTRTKHGADKVAKKLVQLGVEADAIHGNKAQNRRTRSLDAFRAGRLRVLVATDVAARGLDIDDISHVVNFDLPDEPEAYVHRIGRTGRAGAAGDAIAFCDSEETGQLRAIERLVGSKIEVKPLPRLAELPRTAEPPHRAASPRSDERRRQPRSQSKREGTGHRSSSASASGAASGSASGAGSTHAPKAPHTPGGASRSWNRPSGGSRRR